MARRMESSTLFSPDVERSDAVDPTEQVHSHSHLQSQVPWRRHRTWSSRYFNALKVAACNGRSRDFDGRRAALGLLGSILVTASVALLAIGLSKGSSSAGLPSSGSFYSGGIGVPVDVVTPLPAGSLTDCSVQLGNWDWYSNISAQAEKDYMGFLFSDASRDLVIASLRSLQPITLGIQFWVLVSPSHPWSASFGDAVAVQVDILNAAFASSAILFREKGTYFIPATDADVEGCLTPSPEGVIAHLLSSIDTLSTIQVILCDPAGVNGATSILNGKKRSQGSANRTFTPLDQAIMLRRGALWQSRSSLVHQLGHYFGLSHPFPNTQTCKYDGDSIADTPMQYAGDVGCLASLQSVPLCDTTLTIDSGQYPQFDFMDISNDTCREHFTPGQILRMRSMLFAFRPLLTKADAKSGDRLWPRAAFQSAMAPLNVISRQLNLAIQHTYAGSTLSTSPSMPLEIIQIVGQLTSSLDQARVLLSSNGRTSLDACTCVGTNGNGEAYWTAQLDGSYYVDRVDLALSWEVWSNNTFKTGYSPLIEVRIGYSTRFWDNRICGGAPVPLDKVFKTVACSNSISGSFVTVRWLPQASQVAQGHGQVPMCLCDVRIMSQSIPAWSIGIENSSAVPGMPLNVSAGVASQSSTVQGGSAEQALMPLRPVSLANPSFVPCSETLSEFQPWWQLDLSRPNTLIRGLRLAVPLQCSGLRSTFSPDLGFDTSQLNCSNNDAALNSMDIFVTNTSFAGSTLNAALASLSADSVCASGVLVAPGTMADVDCGRNLLGQVITIVKSRSGNVTDSANATVSSSPTSLQLCGVVPIGGWSLLGADLLSGINQAVYPSSLLPEAFSVVDENLSTCMTPNAPTLGSWFAQLANPYDIVAVSIKAAGGSSSTVQMDLLDINGATAWSSRAQNVSAHASTVNSMVTIAPPIPTSAINVSGFSSICEIRVFTGSRQGLSQNVAQSILLPHPAWSVFLLNEKQATAGDFTLTPMSRAVVDGNPKSCARLSAFPPLVNETSSRSTTLSLPSMKAVIALGMEYVIPTIEVLADAAATNVTVGVWKGPIQLATGNVSFSYDASYWISCGGPVDLSPGERKIISCMPALTGSALLITIPMLPALPFTAPPSFRLCEVNLPGSSYIFS